MIEFKVDFLQFPNIPVRYRYLNNMGWIRIRMDPKLLPGSGTRKIQSWIRIHNTGYTDKKRWLMGYELIIDMGGYLGGYLGGDLGGNLGGDLDDDTRGNKGGQKALKRLVIYR